MCIGSRGGDEGKQTYEGTHKCAGGLRVNLDGQAISMLILRIELKEYLLGCNQYYVSQIKGNGGRQYLTSKSQFMELWISGVVECRHRRIEKCPTGRFRLGLICRCSRSRDHLGKTLCTRVNCTQNRDLIMVFRAVAAK